MWHFLEIFCADSVLQPIDPEGQFQCNPLSDIVSCTLGQTAHFTKLSR